jgi:hypothetical protein
LRIPALASNESNPGNDNPTGPNPPILRKFRREIPSQNGRPLSAGARIFSMVSPVDHLSLAQISFQNIPEPNSIGSAQENAPEPISRIRLDNAFVRKL